jgi:hypothetical protein
LRQEAILALSTSGGRIPDIRIYLIAIKFIYFSPQASQSKAVNKNGIKITLMEKKG